MRVLITGATGLVGSHTVRAFAEAGHEVRALVRRGSDLSTVSNLTPDLAYGDVTDPASLAEAVRGCEAVVHTVAIVSAWAQWEEYFNVGVRGTDNVLAAAASAGVRRFVQLSSVAVYGFRAHGRVLHETDPYDHQPENWNPYVREKVQSERLAFEYHQRGELEVTAVRPSVIWGAGDRTAFPRTVALQRSPLAALVGRGRNRVPCVSARDVADICLRAATLPAAAGRAYNASAAEEISQSELMALVARSAGLRPAARHVPAKLVWAAATAFETAYSAAGIKSTPPLTRMNLAIIASDVRVDTSLAREQLGWRQLQTLPDAIAEDARWYAPGAAPSVAPTVQGS